jgi:outer membrane protein assembly factor BamB
VFVTPAVAGDRIYLGSCGGTFFALDSATGALAWSYDTSPDGRPPGQFHGALLLTEKLVVAGSDSHSVGHLYAFDRATGAVRWKLPFPKGVAADLWRRGEAVLFASEVGDVAAVELATGELLWQAEEPPEGARGPRPLDLVLAGERLVVAWRSGSVEAYRPQDGSRLWLRDLGATLNASPVVVGGDIVVGTFDGRLQRLRGSDGEAIGSFALGGALYGDLVLAPGCLLALSARGGSDPMEGLAGPHAVFCLDPDLQGVQWRHDVPEAFHPLGHGGAVVVGIEGKLLALELASGALLWERPIQGLPRGLAATGDWLYVGTSAGPVFALPWAR